MVLLQQLLQGRSILCAQKFNTANEDRCKGRHKTSRSAMGQLRDRVRPSQAWPYLFKGWAMQVHICGPVRVRGLKDLCPLACWLRKQGTALRCWSCTEEPLRKSKSLASTDAVLSNESHMFSLPPECNMQPHGSEIPASLGTVLTFLLRDQLHEDPDGILVGIVYSVR